MAWHPVTTEQANRIVEDLFQRFNRNMEELQIPTTGRAELLGIDIQTWYSWRRRENVVGSSKKNHWASTLLSLYRIVPQLNTLSVLERQVVVNAPKMNRTGALINILPDAAPLK